MKRFIKSTAGYQIEPHWRAEKPKAVVRDKILGGL